MINLKQKFVEWYKASFDKEADLSDGDTHLMCESFIAGYATRGNVSRSPVQVKQTPESAAALGRQLQPNTGCLTIRAGRSAEQGP
jgi:hypothetical protein